MLHNIKNIPVEYFFYLASLIFILTAAMNVGRSLESRKNRSGRKNSTAREDFAQQGDLLDSNDAWSARFCDRPFLIKAMYPSPETEQGDYPHMDILIVRFVDDEGESKSEHSCKVFSLIKAFLRQEGIDEDAVKTHKNDLFMFSHEEHQRVIGKLPKEASLAMV